MNTQKHIQILNEGTTYEFKYTFEDGRSASIRILSDGKLQAISDDNTEIQRIYLKDLVK